MAIPPETPAGLEALFLEHSAKQLRRHLPPTGSLHEPCVFGSALLKADNGMRSRRSHAGCRIRGKHKGRLNNEWELLFFVFSAYFFNERTKVNWG